LHLPPGFDTDPLVTYVQMIPRDNDPMGASDWFDLCKLASLRASGVTAVALFVDNSGSLTKLQVQASINIFADMLEKNGLELRDSIVNQNENYIAPFKTDFACDVKPQGRCCFLLFL